MNMEDELRGALRREAPSAGFSARVLAKTKAPLWRRPLVWAVAAGLAVASSMPPAISEYRRREQARGLEAKRELLVALSITRARLLRVKERIRAGRGTYE